MLSVIILLAASSPSAAPVHILEIQDARRDRPNMEGSSDFHALFSAAFVDASGAPVVPGAALRRVIVDTKIVSHREAYSEDSSVPLGEARAPDRVIRTRIIRVGAECAIVAQLSRLDDETVAFAKTQRSLCSNVAVTRALQLLGRRLGWAVAGRDVPLSQRSAFVAADLSPEAWQGFSERAERRLGKARFTEFLSTGLSYASWAADFNDRSESVTLEVIKWATTALSVVALGFVVFDEDARQSAGFWAPATLAAFGPASLSWSIDAFNFGNVPTRLE